MEEPEYVMAPVQRHRISGRFTVYGVHARGGEYVVHDAAVQKTPSGTTFIVLRRTGDLKPKPQPKRRWRRRWRRRYGKKTETE